MCTLVPVESPMPNTVLVWCIALPPNHNRPYPSCISTQITTVNACRISFGVACGSTVIPALHEKAQAPGSGVQVLGLSEQRLWHVAPTYYACQNGMWRAPRQSMINKANYNQIPACTSSLSLSPVLKGKTRFARCTLNACLANPSMADVFACLAAASRGMHTLSEFKRFIIHAIHLPALTHEASGS